MKAQCTQTITVNDSQNSTSYIIYATKEAKFGENNVINGNVGVTALDGKADFKKNVILDPFFVKAKNIEVSTPAQVNNRIFIAANDGPNPTFVTYNGNTTDLPNFTVTSNTTLSGNFKDLTINQGLSVTINGNNFGKIEIKEGATVTFSNSNINIVELIVKKGTLSTNTKVLFTNPTSIKVKNKVSIDENCGINIGGPICTFYLGDNNDDAEKFVVKGNNTQVTANIMIPSGKLKVDGGDITCVMTGWFIIEKVESSGKNIHWNKYNCGTQFSSRYPSSLTENLQNIDAFSKLTSPSNKEAIKAANQDFIVHVFPTPSANDFNLNIESKTNEIVTVKIMDMTGKIVSISVHNKLINLKVGATLKAGTYFAEITQGNKKQIAKLIKIN